MGLANPTGNGPWACHLGSCIPRGLISIKGKKTRGSSPISDDKGRSAMALFMSTSSEMGAPEIDIVDGGVSSSDLRL